MATETPRDVAAAWQPQRPGRRGAKDIPDAIVEPDWGGMRVVAALTEDEVALYSDGGEVPVPDELLQALLDAFGAGEAVIEGHVTTAALRSSTGAFPKMPTVERPPILVPRAIRKDVKDDPFVRARDYEQAAARLEPAVREALERGSDTRSSRPTCCGSTAARSPTCRCSSDGGSSRASCPSRTSSGSPRSSGRRRC